MREIKNPTPSGPAAQNKEEAIRFHVSKLAELVDIATPPELTNTGAGEPTPGAELTVDARSPTILLDVGLVYLGYHEEEQNEKLMAAFEEYDIRDYNGKILDPDKFPWCAGFFDLLLAKAGLSTVGSLAAKDFQAVYLIGNDKIEEPEPGDGAFWDNHIAVFAGRCNIEQKFTDITEWEKAKTPNGKLEMVYGGNQSDGANISPKKWYDNYSTFRGYARIA